MHHSFPLGLGFERTARDRIMERLMRLSRIFWDFTYLTGLTPWNSEEPAEELINLVGGGAIKPCRVLDIGCGTGTNVIYLATKGFEAHGLDISKIALLKARRRIRNKDVICYFHNLDFRDMNKVSELGQFNLATDFGCYHSLSPGIDRAQYIRSLNTVLRRGGEYLLWCFARGKLWSWGPPGVDENEVEENFGERYEILEKRKLYTSFRDLLFYHTRRVS